MRKLLAFFGIFKKKEERPKCMYGGPEMFFRNIEEDNSNPKNTSNNSSQKEDNQDSNIQSNDEKNN